MQERQAETRSKEILGRNKNQIKEKVMGQKIYLSSEFEVETCCNCGTVFAVPKEYATRRKNDHKSFHCPNGHSQYYSAKSDKEKLQDQLEHCRLDRDFWQDGHDAEKNKRQAVERSRSSLRGVITKMKVNA